MDINEIAIYLDAILCIIACSLFTLSIQAAEKVNKDIRIKDESYQWFDDKRLYRLVLRLKLGILLLMSTLCLISSIARIYPTLVLFPTLLLSVSSVLFYVCLTLLSFIFYVVYSKSNFAFLKINKNYHMEQRLNEFKQCLANLKATDLAGVTTDGLTQWGEQWVNYVNKGGIIPPTAPPHP